MHKTIWRRLTSFYMKNPPKTDEKNSHVELPWLQKSTDLFVKSCWVLMPAEYLLKKVDAATIPRSNLQTKKLQNQVNRQNLQRWFLVLIDWDGGVPYITTHIYHFAGVINKFHSTWLHHKTFATQKMDQGQERSNKIHEFSAWNLQLRDIIGIGFVTQSSTSWHFCQARLEGFQGLSVPVGFSFGITKTNADLGVTIYRNCPWISYGEVAGWNPRTVAIHDCQFGRGALLLLHGNVKASKTPFWQSGNLCNLHLYRMADWTVILNGN